MNSPITANPKVLWREVHGEIVILDPHKGRYYGIEGSGVRMWELFQKGMSFQRVFKVLMKECDVDEKRLKKDMLEFVDQLRQSGLVDNRSCRS